MEENTVLQEQEPERSEQQERQERQEQQQPGQPAGNGSQTTYKIICAVLAIGIIAVFCLFVLPKLRANARARDYGSLENIDFSSSQWLDEYMEKTAGLYGLYFTEGSAFSAGQGVGIASVTYASELSVEELREEYKTKLSATEYGRNDETALHLSATLPEGELDIVNYFSQVMRIIDAELTLGAEDTVGIEAQLDAAFPEAELAAVEEISALRAREAHGRYVRYIYDDMNEYLYKGLPIFSEARLLAEGEQGAAEFDAAVAALKSEYTSNTYDATGDTNYFRTESGILGLTLSQTSSGAQLAAISFQFFE